MLRFLFRKIPSAVGLMIFSSIAVFLLPRLAPGDPALAIAGGDATEEAIAEIRETLGLDRSLVEQYWVWITGVFRGDFGDSYLYRLPVSELISGRFQSTIELAVSATIFLIIFGVGMGVLGGTTRSRKVKSVLDVVVSFLLSTPPFLIGIVLIILLGVVWQVLPISGEVNFIDDPATGFKYLLLPSFALSLSSSAVVARLIQTQMISVRGEDFVDLAKAKGVPPSRIAFRHVLRNSLGASIVAVGLQVGHLLSGTIIIESLFARNGLGSLTINAVFTRDYLVLQAVVLFAIAIAIAIQLISEILLAALDPRVRLGSE